MEELANLSKKCNQKARNLAEAIRKYSKSKKDFWQRIPLLALEIATQERSLDEYHGLFGKQYELGLLDLWTPSSPGNYLAVDLATGDIVYNQRVRNIYHGDERYRETRKSTPSVTRARTQDVLTLLPDLKQLDAEKIVNQLIRRKRKSPDYQLKRDILMMRQVYDISEKYVRRKFYSRPPVWLKEAPKCDKWQTYALIAQQKR